MPTINIQCLDQGVVERLKRRASRNDRSLEDEALHILEGAAAENEQDSTARRAAFLEWIDHCHRLTAGRKHTPAEVLIREDRDR